MTWYLDEITTDVINDGTGHYAIAYGNREFILPGGDAAELAAKLPGALSQQLAGDYGPVGVMLKIGDPTSRATWSVSAVPDGRATVPVTLDIPASLAWRMQRDAGPWPVDLSREIPFLLVDAFPSRGLRPQAVVDARARMRASADDWAEVMRIVVLECGIGLKELSEAFGMGMPTILHWCKGTSGPHHMAKPAMLDRLDGLLAGRAASWERSRRYKEARVSDILSRLGPAPD